MEEIINKKKNFCSYFMKIFPSLLKCWINFLSWTDNFHYIFCFFFALPRKDENLEKQVCFQKKYQKKRKECETSMDVQIFNGNLARAEEKFGQKIR